MAAVEWYAEQAMKLEIEILHGKISIEQMLNQLSIVLKQAEEMERQEKIEFACAVYDKYNFGQQDISFREECEQFKSE